MRKEKHNSYSTSKKLNKKAAPLKSQLSFQIVETPDLSQEDICFIADIIARMIYRNIVNEKSMPTFLGNTKEAK